MSDEQRYPKRLIEVDLPIKEISAHARREKSIRKGHLATLHIWWARKPLGAMRSIICAALWPDPADTNCPPELLARIREAVAAFAHAVRTDKYVRELTPRSWSTWERLHADGHWEPTALREVLLRFLADYANWDASFVPAFETLARTVTAATYPSHAPILVDPFAGGGSIPLVALHVGAMPFATDINPVAVIQNKLLIEILPQRGSALGETVREWGRRIRDQAREELKHLYPAEPDGAIPLAYLWVRQIRCEGPACGAEVLLLPSNWIVRKPGKRLIARIPTSPNDPYSIEPFRKESDVRAVMKLGNALCPFCGFTTPKARVRAQLVQAEGGAGSARMIAVVRTHTATTGRTYRTPEAADTEAARTAEDSLRNLLKVDPNAVPTESIPLERMWRNNPIRVNLYGMKTWANLHTPRQAVVLASFAKLIREIPPGSGGENTAVKTALALALDRLANTLTSLSRWDKTRESLQGLFSRPSINMMWDYAEGNPFSGGSGDWDGAVEWVAQVLETNGELVARSGYCGQAQYASATLHPLPSDSAAIIVTDPPYYDAIPYGTISDFFYVWLKRTLGSSFPELLSWPLIPKDEECAVDDAKGKDQAFFARTMTSAMGECRRVLMPSGIAVVIFANTSTEAWETQLASMIEAGLIITGSWPIDTEMAARLRAQDSAVLASSICLVARPREAEDGSVATNTVGDWREVLDELPRRIKDWLPRLADEGVVGADAIFACLGPALEIFSRYARVEKASGDHVLLREYLEHVWAVVSREALSRIFDGADTGGLEADARLSAMWLWTVASGRMDDVVVVQAEVNEFSESEEVEAGELSKASQAGFSLDFDTARKIAQGLGARLEELTRVVAVEGETARLLSVAERAQYLFSNPEGRQATRKTLKKGQMPLFSELADIARTQGWDDVGVPSLGTTTLDRVHQAMLLFASGRGEALKRFLVEEGVGRQAPFWKLAQSLSALYPSGSDERRWVEGVLARKKGLGFG